MTSIRFGAVYRLTENQQPVKDEAKARAAFGKFQAQNNNSGYFFAQKANIDRGPISNCYIMTSSDKEDHVRKVGQLMKLAMKAIFSKKAEKKYNEAEKNLWTDTAAKASDLEIGTL